MSSQPHAVAAIAASQDGWLPRDAGAQQHQALTARTREHGAVAIDVFGNEVEMFVVEFARLTKRSVTIPDWRVVREAALHSLVLMTRRVCHNAMTTYVRRESDRGG